MISKPSIVLVPIGSVPEDVLAGLTEPLSLTFHLPCRSAASIPIPSTGYDRQRGQYRGDAILTALARLELPDAARVLGLIDADCYTPGLNFILGQARIQSRDAFIALPRLRQPFYSLRQDQSLFLQRAVKEAVHELGHTYGLEHCPKRRCVMHFSNSLGDTDFKDAEFCWRFCVELKELTEQRWRFELKGELPCPNL